MLLVSCAAFGQEPSRFHVGAGLGYAHADQRNGGSIYVEPTFAMGDNFLTGLQLEYAMIGSSRAGDPSSGIISFSANGRYYLNQNRLRPFVGAGMGVYYLSNDILAPGFQSVSSFGFYPRLGFDIGHLAVVLDYNFVSRQMPAAVTVFGVPVGSTEQKDANYVGLKLGYVFRGRRAP